MALAEAERRACDLIEARGGAMLDELAAHVAIPTGRGHAPGLDAYRGLLEARLSSLGAAIDMVPGRPRPAWVDPPGHGAGASPGAPGVPGVPGVPGAPPPVMVARRAGRRGPARILIAGHIDTVHDPHGPFQSLAMAPDGRTVTGPGAVDMKGGIVIALTALAALAESGADVAWTFLLNSDEETGSFHSEPALRAEAPRHEFGICLEPALAGGGLVIERGGSAQFMVETFGRAAHAGRDFAQGVSAVVELARVIQALDALGDPARGLIVNTGPLAGGAATNIVPDHAACWGNARFPDAAAAERLSQGILGLRRTGPRDGLPRVEVRLAVNRPAKPASDATRRLAERAAAAAADLGLALPLGRTAGVCDGNILQDAGLPTLDSLGACGGNLHRTDEYVEVGSLVERCRLLAVVLLRLGGPR
jgi:glutamate carboxypeptidase